MMKPSILGIGVATMDIYVNQNRMYPGGNEYNVACNAKILGADAGFLGVFSKNRAGQLLEKTLQDFDIRLNLCRHEEGSSGYSLVELTEDGDRIFLEWNHKGVADLYPITFTDEEISYIKQYQVVSIGRCSNVSIENIKKMKAQGIDICYDFHSTFSEEEISSIAPYIEYGFFSCSHLNTSEIKSTLKHAVTCGCKIAIGTRGAASVWAYDGENYYEQETTHVEKVLDALGAGDSYIAAFLVSYLKQKPNILRIPNALSDATKHSASVIQIEGSVGIGYDVNPSEIDFIIK